MLETEASVYPVYLSSSTSLPERPSTPFCFGAHSQTFPHPWRALPRHLLCSPDSKCCLYADMQLQPRPLLNSSLQFPASFSTSPRGYLTSILNLTSPRQNFYLYLDFYLHSFSSESRVAATAQAEILAAIPKPFVSYSTSNPATNSVGSTTCPAKSVATT